MIEPFLSITVLRNMKKFIFLIIVIIPVLSIRAQEWCKWSLHYEFQLKNSGPSVGRFTFENIEVLVNWPINDNGFMNGNLIFNDSNSTYSIDLFYGGSCAFKGLDTPPDLLLKILLFEKMEEKHFSILVPISSDTLTLEMPEKFILPLTVAEYPGFPKLSFNLGTIVFNDYIVPNYDKILYEGIRIKSNWEITKYTSGEYQFPRLKTMIQLTL